jgi:hypothetical protein
LLLSLSLFFFLFFGSAGVWTLDLTRGTLPLESLHQPFFCVVHFPNRVEALSSWSLPTQWLGLQAWSP